MSDLEAAPTPQSPAWPDPPTRLYPHRYVTCSSCSRTVRDFQGDQVWRDDRGQMTCAPDADLTVPGSWHAAPIPLPWSPPRPALT